MAAYSLSINRSVQDELDFHIQAQTQYAHIERYLDLVGYFPVSAQYSAIARPLLAVVQLIHILALFTFAFLLYTLDSTTQEAFDRFNLYGYDLIKNAFFHLIRTGIKTVYLWGNLGCFIYETFFKSTLEPSLLGYWFGYHVKALNVHYPILPLLF
jgi:hypothetical protein